MSILGGTTRHLVRVGTLAERRYLIGEVQNSYDGLLFNANLVAWAPAGVAAFLCQPDLILKPILIDPITHAFQHDPSLLLRGGDSDVDQEEEDGVGNQPLKASFQKLVDSYGSPLETAGQEACVPDTFNDNGLSAAFTERVVDFQRSTIHQKVIESDAYDFLAFGQEDDFQLARPEALIAPYFYMSPTTYSAWLSVNTDFVQLTRQFAGDLPVAAQIVLDSDLLHDPTAMAAIADGYASTEADIFLIWIDAFSEHDTGRQALDGFITLARGLRRDGNKRVLNLYGGFFSILLAHPEVAVLDGVCHGPQYGEQRSVIPIGGGLPTAKFYLPGAHHRLRYKDALGVLRKYEWLDTTDAYYENVCHCPQCRQLIDGSNASSGFARYGASKSVTFVRQGRTVSMAVPLQDTKDVSTLHYMHRKKAEFDLVSPLGATSLTTILDDLEAMHETLSRPLGLDSVGYLKLWADVLRPQPGH